MKEYKDTPEESKDTLNEPVAAYQVAQSFAPIDADDMDDDIPLDENGKPIGYTADEIFDEVDHDLSEFYGVDFMKVTRMIRSGELDENAITDELLCSEEFKYEPYPGFKPKPLPEDFVPDPSLTGIFDDDDDDEEIAQQLQYLTLSPEFKIPLDKNGKPIGHTLEEFSEKLLDKLSEAYGVDLHTL